MKTKLHREIDRLTEQLKKSGHDIKRSTLIESLAKARGFRNAHEMINQAQKEESQQDDTKSREEVSAADYLATDDDDVREELRRSKIEIEQLKNDLKSAHNIGTFDWTRWKKTVKAIKSASHHGTDPIDDEKLMLIRQAVSDNHSKSSASERSEARYRVGQVAERMMPGLLTRLDRAEELLGKGEIISEPVLDALENVVHIEAVRDGDSFSESFIPKENGLNVTSQAVLLAAKAYKIENIADLTEDPDMPIEEAIEEMEADMDYVRIHDGEITINIKEAIKALKKGEGSLLLHDALRDLARSLGLESSKSKMI